MLDPSGDQTTQGATDGVADGNVNAGPPRHGNFAKRMAIEISVVRELAALRAIESEWRSLASCGSNALFRGPDWLLPWWSAYHATLGAELHVLVGRATEGDTNGT